MLEKYLQDLGLNEKEAIIYIALLQVDTASVVSLAKKTSINRSTTYTVLDSLAKKGLVSEIQIGKKTHYQAEKPERLETYVEKRKIILEEQSKRLKDIIPMLKTVTRESGERPVVKYFEGRDGIVSSTEEFFAGEEKNDLAYFFYPNDLMDEALTEAEKKYFHTIRNDKNIKAKVLYTRKGGDLASDAMGERLRIDEKAYPITCDIAIYKDKVRMNTMGKSFSGIFIRSKDIADTLRSIFNLAYDNLSKNTKKKK
jgi:sugar-specific transcriptional regulator TrmB